MSVQTQILSNNVTLITEPVAGVKTAAVGFWFRTGSRFEPENMRGISHFVEHMLFKGTSTRSAFDIAASFDRIGGYINAYTDRENLCIHCVVPADYVTDAVKIITDMTSSSLFDSKEVERERSVIKNEIIASLEDSEEVALDAASAAVWPNHPVSVPIAGTVEDVEGLSREDLYSWYTDYIKNGATVVCVAGCFEKECLESVLETLPNRSSADWSSIHGLAPQWTSGLRFQDAPFNQMQLFMQFPLEPHISEKDYYTWAIVNALVGDTMSSRLFQKLREEGGYSYNVYSFPTYYTDAACWCAYATVSKKDTAGVVKTMYRELEKLKQDSFSEEEQNAACEHICGEEIISSEDMEYRVKRLFRNYSFGFSQKSTEEILSLIRSISKKEIEKTIQTLLDFDNASLFVYGSNPSKTLKDKIEKIQTGIKIRKPLKKEQNQC